MTFLAPDAAKIAVIGLGYVGLPLALAFGRGRDVVGFDVDEARVAALKRGEDKTREATADEIAGSRVVFTSDPANLDSCDVFIVAVPTPIDTAKRPDLRGLVSASETAGRALRPGGIVVYESTVYPGCTEEVCAPVVARASGLAFNEGFFLGYSPERMNPGDRAHRLETIVKVTSGSTPEAARFVDALYASIVTAGTHLTSSIAVAEAAKVIENTQRDLNIALMNELSLIFGRLGLDTSEVLEAAATKWNFIDFRPGLVGGHCIGVDPYYLTHKAQQAGHNPEIILAGRRINDAMGEHAADQTARLMMTKGIPVVGSRILVMGATFKENCPDLRNSRVADVIARLKAYRAIVELWEPCADVADCERTFGVAATADQPAGPFDGIVIAVAHDAFRRLGPEGIQAMRAPTSIVFDIKSLYPRSTTDGRF